MMSFEAAASPPRPQAALRAHGLLGGLPDPALDRVTRLATSICQVPLASVSLVVDGRLYTASASADPAARSAGLPAALWGAPSTDFPCGAVAETGLPLIVSDARRHDELRDLPAVTRDGIVAYAGVPLRTPDGAISGTLCVIDHKPRRWSEAELASLTDLAALATHSLALRLETERRSVIDAEHQWLSEWSPLAMWAFDAETLALLAVNDAAIKQYGYTHDEFLQMRVTDLAPPEEVATFLDAYARRFDASRPRYEGRWNAGIFRHQRKDGTVIDVEVVSDEVRLRGRPARVFVAQDITERRCAERATWENEERRRQAQKMEAVGRLAGGIAHDFNNLLTAITLHCQALLTDAGEGAGNEDLGAIAHAADCATDLTRQLLAFSRRQMLQPRVLDLNEHLERGARLLRRLVGERVAVELELDPAIGAVRADPAQLERVLLNLAVNARDAMPAGGALGIATAEVTIDGAVVEGMPGLKSGRYVTFTLADSGDGMSADVQARLFEPFFTTKGLGKGSGLGLSTVYGIVKQSGGYIYVDSALGRGTKFTVYLPRYDGEVPRPAPALAATAERRTGATILLVEDDGSVRRPVKQLLAREGYTVVECQDGADALRLVETLTTPIDMVLTDLVMPGIGGRELVTRLRAARPDLKVLFMSGYSEDSIETDGLVGGGAAFIQKPFTIVALRDTVRQLLADA